MSSRAKIAAAAAALGLILAAGWFVARRGGDEPPAGVREMARSQLELRDGMLYATGEPEAFGGMLVEHFPGGGRRLAIEIHDGKAHGVSRGWHENGRLEVEEHFVHGVSHGSRIRWYPNGVRKSEAQIVEGVIEGTFPGWHDKGRKAAVA
ncbi:MAG: hypothetical protein K9M97_01810, partial [Akkermansiaceae bacterium]|nr:hypothetical protein [Akkermansiaceae bacterium]